MTILVGRTFALAEPEIRLVLVFMNIHVEVSGVWVCDGKTLLIFKLKGKPNKKQYKDYNQIFEQSEQSLQEDEDTFFFLAVCVCIGYWLLGFQNADR